MTDPQTASLSHRFSWRRLFQYRLHTILIFTTIIAVFLGWWSHKARQQQKAVAALMKAGARVQYDIQAPSLKQPSYWPEWLINALGVDFFGSVIIVDMSELKFLTDTELRHLDRLTALQTLDLDWANIDDAGLKNLKHLNALKRLDLRRTQTTDFGVQQLKHLKDLQYLGLRCTIISDRGVEHLKDLHSLQNLNLSETRVTDSGVEHLKLLTNLKVLQLDDTTITDAGLEHLRGLTCLKILRVNGTRVTESGVERLQKALPNCNIVYYSLRLDQRQDAGLKQSSDNELEVGHGRSGVWKN